MKGIHICRNFGLKFGSVIYIIIGDILGIFQIIAVIVVFVAEIELRWYRTRIFTSKIIFIIFQVFIVSLIVFGSRISLQFTGRWVWLPRWWVRTSWPRLCWSRRRIIYGSAKPSLEIDRKRVTALKFWYYESNTVGISWSNFRQIFRNCGGSKKRKPKKFQKRS